MKSNRCHITNPFLEYISNPTYVGIGTRHTQRTDDLVSGGVVGMVLMLAIIDMRKMHTAQRNMHIA